MRRGGKRVERASRVRFAEARIHELVLRVLAHHRLRAGTRRHAFGLHADDAPRAGTVGVSDADERVGLFATFAAHRRPAFQAELGAQAHVRTDCPLTADDLARDGFGESLDARGLRVARQDVERCLLQNLREARHVDARFIRREIRYHRELGVVDARAPVDFEVDDATDAGDAGTVDAEANLRLFRLAVGVEAQAALAAPNGAVGGRRDEVRRDLRQRSDVVGTLVEVFLYDGSIEDQEIDVDRTGGQTPRSARATHGQLDVASEPFELLGIQLAAERGGDVEEFWSFGAVRGGGFVERRYRNDLRAPAQALQRGEDVSLPVAEIRSDPDVDLVHAASLLSGRLRARRNESA